jgi:hypothetical protein
MQIHIKKHLLISFFLLFANFIYAQQQLEKDIDAYTAVIKEKVVQMLTHKDYGKGYNEKYLLAVSTGKFLFVPKCIYDSKNIASGANDLDLTSILKDSSTRGYRMYYVGGVFSVLPESPLMRHDLDSTVYDDDLMGNDDLYYFAQKKTNRALLLRVKEGEDHNWGKWVWAYIDQGKLYLVDRIFMGSGKPDKTVQFSGMKEYVENNFGAIEKYLEVIYEDSVRNFARHLPISSCKEILGHSYWYYEKVYASDTATITVMFLNELDSMANLTKTQRDFIRVHFKEKVAECYKDDSLHDVEFMGKDLEFMLNRTLTLKQKYAYEKAYFLKRDFESTLFWEICADYDDRHITEINAFISGAISERELKQKELASIFDDGIK